MSTRQDASAAYAAWVRDSVAPIAHRHGFAGRAPTFRRHEGEAWTIFALERRPIDPNEAQALADASQIPFRLHLGVATDAGRPKWAPASARPPGMRDITMYAPTPALEPPDGAFWHVFDPTDVAAQQQLLDWIESALAAGLDALGDSSLRSILETKIAFAGPLENLSPGLAEELLSLADTAGAADVRTRIVEALARPPVPDPTVPSLEDQLRILQDAFPGAQISTIGPPPPGSIRIQPGPRRRSASRRARLLADLASERTYPRRQAAVALGRWDGDGEVVDALRRATEHPDAWTRFSAAISLGHLGDASPGTWHRALSMAADADAGPREVGETIVLLAELDRAGRADGAREALVGMADRYPAWTRDLRAFASRLQTTDRTGRQD